jgi:hypothetical protein
MAVSDSELLRQLTELIAALDRRVPRVDAAGERAIARDAAALRSKAAGRLAELVDAVADRPCQGSSDPS